MRGGRSPIQRRERSSKVDMLILAVMVVLFMLTMTITFSPTNFPTRELHSVPVAYHIEVGQDPVENSNVKENGVHTRTQPTEESSEEQARNNAAKEAEEEARRQREEKERREGETRKQREEAARKQQLEEEARKQREEAERRQKEEEERKYKEEEERKRQEEEEVRRRETAKARAEVEQNPPDKQKWPSYTVSDPENYDTRRKLMSAPPKALGDEWKDEEEAKCSRHDCPWKGPYLNGSMFYQEKAGCDPRGRNCRCLAEWGGKDQCPESFPEEKKLIIAGSGWLFDFMPQFIEGQYDCPNSAPFMVNFNGMKEDISPDIYLNTDVYGIYERWNKMLDHKKAKAKPNSKMALLYIEAEPHVSDKFSNLPELDISITFYNWADIHVTHLQDHPSWFRNAPYPFHLKRNITFINTGCYGHRRAVVEEFMKYVDVEALGPCLNNADYCKLFPLCCHGHWHGSYTSRYVEKECLIHHYKFVLALENTITYNYTTEKFFQPLKMGTVPLYWGSPSSAILVPNTNAVIRIDDFPTVKDAALYVKELLVDEDKYNKHLEWKWKAYREEFKAEIDHGLSSFVCRLADAYKLGKTFYGASKMPKS